jgi:hypothetical protein
MKDHPLGGFGMCRLWRILRAALLVLCISFAARAADKEAPVGIKVDKEKRTVTIDCKVALRKMDDPKFQGKTYPIEIIACYPYPKGQKAHETVVTIDVKPSDVHKALEELGLRAGKPVSGQTKETPQGPEVNVYVEIPRDNEKPRRVPIEKTLVGSKSGKPMPRVKWYFTGSVMTKPAADKTEEVYGADLTGTLIAVFPVTNETVLQTSLKFDDQHFLELETDKKVLPKEGTPVKLVIEVPPTK